jgi:hypothetical protein
MNTFYRSILFMLTITLLPGCNGKKAPKKEAAEVIDSVAVADTGYTGIKQYMGGKYLIKEVTFKNGVREGLMKSFYMTGEVRHTFWYKNGLREDSSIWFYQEGQKFRVTPFKKDTIDGIQKQYYRNGKLKAKLGYSRGLRSIFFQEFTPEGKLVGGYPSLVVNVTDNYKTQGIYKVKLELSDKSQNVRYWRGDFADGLFDTAHCEKLKTIKGIAALNLKKTTAKTSSYVGVIAEILTNFGNNYLVYKKIDLPYKDLK